VFARTFVDVIATPGIFRDALEVGPMPTGDVTRLLEQVIKAVAAFGVVTRVDLERIQRRLEIGDLGLRGGDTRLLAAPHHLWVHNGRQRCQDDQHE